MVTFHFNLSQVTTLGYGRYGRAPKVQEVAVALAQLPNGTIVETAKPQGTPLEISPPLTKRLRHVGLVAIDTTSEQWKELGPEKYEKILTKIVRNPFPSPCSHRERPTKDSHLDRFSHDCTYGADAGDIPVVHQAVRQGKVDLLEVDEIWQLASPLLSGSEAVRFARKCLGNGIGKALAHPLFPLEQSNKVIMDYIVRRMRCPDLLLMRPAKIEHHIGEVGSGDFQPLSPDDFDQFSMISRGMFWFLIFSKWQSPEHAFVDTVYNVLDGIAGRTNQEQEAILQSVEQQYPKLGWLLRDVRSHRKVYEMYR
ncbi:MAG: hypothetical protein ABIE84_05515 [bacterium]